MRKNVINYINIQAKKILQVGCMLGVCISNFYCIALLHNMAVFEHEILRIAVANSRIFNAEQTENNVIIDHLLTDKLAQVNENMVWLTQSNYLSRIYCLKFIV